uniref:Expressed protein n=2 Tax=Schizophyllum commune (strain H4-8 / FGSC 9210) TaxID=578458 RepID=D8QE49_SCHCM
MGETRPADRWPFSPIVMLAFTVNNVAAHPHLQNLKSVVVGLERGADTVLLRRATTAPAVALTIDPASSATDSSDPAAPVSSAETTHEEGSANAPVVDLSNQSAVDLPTLLAYHPVATMLETSLHALLAVPRLRSLGTSGLPVDFALTAVGRRGSRLRHLTLKVDLQEELEMAYGAGQCGLDIEPQTGIDKEHVAAPVSTESAHVATESTGELNTVQSTSESRTVEPPPPVEPLPPAWRWLVHVRDFVGARLQPDDSGKAPHRLRSVTVEVLTGSSLQPSANIDAPSLHAATVPRPAIERTLREMHALGTRGIIKMVDGSGWEFDTKYPDGR